MQKLKKGEESKVVLGEWKLSVNGKKMAEDGREINDSNFFFSPFFFNVTITSTVFYIDIKGM